MSSFLMSPDDFLFYADNISLAAQAGISSAQTMFESILPASLLDLTSVEIVESPLSSKNDLLVNLRSSYEQIFLSASANPPMRDVFRDLATHIRDFTNDSVDQFLSDNEIQVDSTYAEISRVNGELISAENIRS